MINLRINHKRITEFSVSLGLFVIIVMLMVSGSVATSIVADKSSSISTSSSSSTSTNAIIVNPPSITHNGNSLVIHPAYLSFRANNHHHYSSHSKSTSSSGCNCPKPSNITKSPKLTENSVILL